MLMVMIKGRDYPKKTECKRHKKQYQAKEGDIVVDYCKRCGFEKVPKFPCAKFIGIRVKSYADGIVVQDERGFLVNVI